MRSTSTLCLVMVLALLALSAVCNAESGQQCASNCVSGCEHLGSGKEYATCLQNCLKGCYDKPTGVPDVPPPSRGSVDATGVYAKAAAQTFYEHVSCQNTHGRQIIAENTTEDSRPNPLRGRTGRFNPSPAPQTETGNPPATQSNPESSNDFDKEKQGLLDSLKK